MIEISKIFLDVANGNSSDPVSALVTPRQPRPSMHVPNTSFIRRKTEDVSLARKETGCSPKKNKLKRLLNPTNANDRAVTTSLRPMVPSTSEISILTMGTMVSDVILQEN
jgi:hypothetical protein